MHMVDEPKTKSEGSLHKKFLIRVLAPPFIVLLILAIVGLWQLDILLRQQALGELRRAASTTAAKIDREFSLRETVLKRTGEEIFTAKSEHQNKRKALDENREKCRDFVRQKFTFSGAPNGVCDPFVTLAQKNTSLFVTIEDEYVRQGLALIAEQDRQINDRLTAFKQFFPETLAMVVVDTNRQIVSTAMANAYQGPAENFQSDATAAVTEAIQGKVISSEGFQLSVFAFPIKDGAVLAAYDLNNENFLKQIWESTPIDRTRSLALILEATGVPAFPNLKDGSSFQNNIDKLRNKPFAEIILGGVNHTAVGASAGESEWLAVVASPAAVVLAPARDSRLIGIAVIGLLLVGYLWLGTFFIRRTLQNVNRLVSGALVFGTSRLDYKIVLSHAASEFVLLAETMNNMAGRIANAEREIDEKNKEFISIATHELRTPLTAILGNLSMVQDDFSEKVDPTIKPIISQAHEGTIRLRNLVNDMLDMARLEGGRVEFVIAPQDIEKLTKEVIESLKIVADEANVRLEYLPSHAQQVLADESKLRIVLNNFVSNAIKYNRPNGHVKVFHELRDDRIITAVADTGLGIPEDQKAHMFEKFFRVQNADRQQVVGTGLGMYITRQYILAMGGDVWFESVHGIGTTFYFSLPLAKTVQAAEAIPIIGTEKSKHRKKLIHKKRFGGRSHKLTHKKHQN